MNKVLGLLVLLAIVAWTALQATAPPLGNTPPVSVSLEVSNKSTSAKPTKGLTTTAKSDTSDLAMLSAHLARPSTSLTALTSRGYCVGGCAYVAPPPRCHFGRLTDGRPCRIASMPRSYLLRSILAVAPMEHAWDVDPHLG